MYSEQTFFENCYEFLSNNYDDENDSYEDLQRIIGDYIDHQCMYEFSMGDLNSILEMYKPSVLQDDVRVEDLTTAAYKKYTRDVLSFNVCQDIFYGYLEKEMSDCGTLDHDREESEDEEDDDFDFDLGFLEEWAILN